MTLPQWFALLDRLFPDTVPEVYCRVCGWHGDRGDARRGATCPTCPHPVTDYNPEAP